MTATDTAASAGTAAEPQAGYVPPPYPYDRLDEVSAVAAAVPGGAIDLSIGTPCDPPPANVVAALSAAPDEAMGYPASIGSVGLRQAFTRWAKRRLGATVDPGKEVAACVGTKEFVATTPQYLKLRTPSRDTVLYPAISYPTYEMGAILAQCRAVPYLTLDDISPEDAARALVLWVNSPSNPTGELVDLGEAAAWGREHDVPVLSDECYAEFTWDGPAGPGGLPGRTILSGGTEGVVAVHSLSKRSNLAGLRVGFYAGDQELVHFLSEVRKHAGFMVPGPAQSAAVAALGDQDHVCVQRDRYERRLRRILSVLSELGLDVTMPGGGFYLWVPAPGGDAWALAERLARELGAIVSPGEFYGDSAPGYVRVAAVQPDEKLDLLTSRIA